uniref:Cuticle protein CPCFC domain-containing protein n=1 Tax=Lepeophtheirus salmonis TaxID=72036 RepID=A0A0K2UKI8_LEPSM
MNSFIVLSALLAVAASAPTAPSLSPICPNYPFCGIGPNELAVATDAQKRVLQQQFALAQPLVPQVPGLDAHFATEAEVLAAQGRVPGFTLHSAAEARVLQAEADLVAVQNYY